MGNDELNLILKIMARNTNPFEKWNDIMYKDNPFAPWNDIMKKDNPFACWNNPFGDGDYKDDVDNYE